MRVRLAIAKALNVPVGWVGKLPACFAMTVLAALGPSESEIVAGEVDDELRELEEMARKAR